MKEILKLNAIADVVKEYLPEDEFAVSTECSQPVGVLVRSADMHNYQLPESVLAVARAGAGVNNIPCDEYAQKGVVVFNTPGANANAVKELVLCAIIMASRNVVQAYDWVQGLKGQENVEKLVESGKKAFVGPEIRGKKLGVLGLGAIGALVANDAVKLGMEVMGNDPFISVDLAWKLSRAVKNAPTREQIFEQCDYITMHAPLTDDTREMINKDSINMMKQGAVVINFSRGALVNNADIIEALNSGKLRAYVTDFPCDELLGVKGVITIPHLGASTPESEDNCAAMAAKELYDYIKYGNIVNSVNYPTCILPYTGRTRLAIAHLNKANMVGQITAVIASDNINISDMINKSRKELAYTVIDTDSEINQSVIADIKGIDGVIRVRVI